MTDIYSQFQYPEIFGQVGQTAGNLMSGDWGWQQYLEPYLSYLGNDALFNAWLALQQGQIHAGAAQGLAKAQVGPYEYLMGLVPEDVKALLGSWGYWSNTPSVRKETAKEEGKYQSQIDALLQGGNIRAGMYNQLAELSALSALMGGYGQYGQALSQIPSLMLQGMGTGMEAALNLGQQQMYWPTQWTNMLYNQGLQQNQLYNQGIGNMLGSWNNAMYGFNPLAMQGAQTIPGQESWFGSGLSGFSDLYNSYQMNNLFNNWYNQGYGGTFGGTSGFYPGYTGGQGQYGGWF
jgi:hypothetical protein